MAFTLRNTGLAALGALAAAAGSPAKAQAYPIDCAILLCLSGGWPASAPCAAAKAEFVRRITPWPIEPPLQVWRCPMGGGGLHLQSGPAQSPWEGARAIEVGGVPERESPDPDPLHAERAVLRTFGDARFAPEALLQVVEDQIMGGGGADIDISGAAFEFVRSIHVYRVDYMVQEEVGGDGDEYCRRRHAVRIGQYGRQGGFSWAEGHPEYLPEAFEGDEGYGEDCRDVATRAVFVDWRDSSGTYGFEQVNY